MNIKKTSFFLLCCLSIGIIVYLFLKPTTTTNPHLHTEKEQKQQETSTMQNKGYYTCPMHPDVKSDTKDDCPICGMHLVWVDGKNNTITKDVVANVTLRPAQLQHLYASTVPVQQMNLTKELRVLARVISSERQESNIPSRIAGRIEKVYHTTTGALIRKGDKLVDIYSPELITAGEEYLALQKELQKNDNPSYKPLAKEAEDKLLLFGITTEQIEEWKKNNAIPKSITLYAPFSGSITTRYAVVGKYVQRGAVLYDVLSLSSVWVQMPIYEKDIALVQQKQEVALTFIPYPAEIWRSNIDFIAPIINKETQTLEVRATLHNVNSKLKPNITGEGYIHIPLSKTLVVPTKAIIQTGKENIVWIQESNNSFIAKAVQVGHTAQGYTQILAGLQEGDNVIVDGAFLLDAQAQLFGGYIIR